MSHLWQWTFDQALTMSQALLAAPKPDSVPDIPYPSVSCADSCDRLKSAPGSKRVDCRFPGCGHSTIHALLRGHVGGHFLLGHRWEGQADGDPHLFCLFCGSCDGRCETTLRANGRVHSTCELAYLKLQVKSASKISKSNPCTNVPVKCSLRTCQKWMCPTHRRSITSSVTHRCHPLTPLFQILKKNWCSTILVRSLNATVALMPLVCHTPHQQRPLHLKHLFRVIVAVAALPIVAQAAVLPVLVAVLLCHLPQITFPLGLAQSQFQMPQHQQW